jgi:hypothetical protein
MLPSNFSGRQPLSRSSVRRCSCIRDWFCYHSIRRPLRILRSQDRPLTLRQAHRRGRLIKKRCLVGTREQAHDPRRKCPKPSVHPFWQKFACEFQRQTSCYARRTPNGERWLPAPLHVAMLGGSAAPHSACTTAAPRIPISHVSCAIY